MSCVCFMYFICNSQIKKKFTIRWLIQLHDLVSYKATTYIVVVTNSDSCNDLGNATIWWVTLPIMVK